MMATGMIQAKLLTPLSLGRGQSADIIHVERQHLHTIYELCTSHDYNRLMTKGSTYDIYLCHLRPVLRMSEHRTCGHSFPHRQMNTPHQLSRKTTSHNNRCM